MKHKALFLFAIGSLTISLLVGCGAKTKVNSDNKLVQWIINRMY